MRIVAAGMSRVWRGLCLLTPLQLQRQIRALTDREICKARKITFQKGSIHHSTEIGNGSVSIAKVGLRCIPVVHVAGLENFYESVLELA